MNGSRLSRAARLGGLAAGQTLRGAGTRAANLGRSPERAHAASERRHLETAERIVTVLGSMKGMAMKLGQMLSVLDPGIVPESHRDEFQRKLAELQATAPSVDFDAMRKVIEADLGGPLSRHFADVDEQAIAAASIGQVYRATLKDGRDVAVKVQYPGIKEVVRADLQNLGLLFRLIGRISPGLDSPEVIAEVRERITEELDYELEAGNQRALARHYRGHPFIVVPGVVGDLCRERVIVTEFVEGRRFTELAGDSAEQRSRWGEILFRFYVSGPLRHRLLNGDPHPGNALFLDDGRVAFLDFGFFKRLSAEEQRIQLETLRAVYEQDADRLYELTVAQGVVSGGRELVEPLLETYRTLTWWFLEDREVTLDTDVAATMLRTQASMRTDYGGLKLPADHVVTLRAFGLALGILGQLRATNNWFRIGREVIYGDPPETELGRLAA